MKISILFVVTVLAISAVATSCTTVAGQPTHGRVYLVGVAGGG